MSGKDATLLTCLLLCSAFDCLLRWSDLTCPVRHHLHSYVDDVSVVLGDMHGDGATWIQSVIAAFASLAGLELNHDKVKLIPRTCEMQGRCRQAHKLTETRNKQSGGRDMPSCHSEKKDQKQTVSPETPTNLQALSNVIDRPGDHIKRVASKVNSAHKKVHRLGSHDQHLFYTKVSQMLWC